MNSWQVGTVKLLIKAVQSKLIDAGIGIAGVILNGSAASHVISDGESLLTHK